MQGEREEMAVQMKTLMTALVAIAALVMGSVRLPL